MDILKIPVHIEVELSNNVLSRSGSDLKELIESKLRSNCTVFKNGYINKDIFNDIGNYIEHVKVCDLPCESISFWKAEICLHIFRLIDSTGEKDFLDGEEELSACEQWELPNKLISGLWDSIVVDNTIKQQLLGYASSSMIFTSAKIDSNIISWNRMILLHGMHHSINI
jgi:hypothetical protein